MRRFLDWLLENHKKIHDINTKVVVVLAIVGSLGMLVKGGGGAILTLFDFYLLCVAVQIPFYIIIGVILEDKTNMYTDALLEAVIPGNGGILCKALWLYAVVTIFGALTM